MYSMVQEQRYIGRVKWFDNKLGYGFIHYKSGNLEKDIFVHWSHLLIPGQEFHTLYQGEYVEFDVIPCEGSEKKRHMKQAHNVSGPQGGPLMAVTNKTMLSMVQGTFASNLHHVFRVQQMETNPANFA